MDAKDNYFVWVVAFINSDHLDICQQQLAKYKEYKEIEPYIPTIKVLKKQFKNKEQFEEVPLLYHYGFFKIPRKYAIHYNFLEDLQKNVSCINGWLKDPVRGGVYDKVPVATATAEEISELIRATVNLGAHSAEDLDLLKPGDYVVLKGYPWEGLECQYLGINEKTKRVRVQGILFMQNKEIEVPFESVFFNLYRDKGYDEGAMGKNSLDEMNERGTLNSFYGKMNKKTKDGTTE